MSSIDSTSTRAQVEAVYADNLSYRTDSSVAKAYAFIEACRWLLMRPMRSGKSGAEVEYDKRLLREEIVEAQRFIRSQSVSTGFIQVPIKFDNPATGEDLEC